MDRSGIGLAAVNALGTNILAFPKSSLEPRWRSRSLIKSSIGTLWIQVRLIPANQESWPFQLKDGEILQLGVDGYLQERED